MARAGTQCEGERERQTQGEDAADVFSQQERHGARAADAGSRHVALRIATFAHVSSIFAVEWEQFDHVQEVMKKSFGCTRRRVFDVEFPEKIAEGGKNIDAAR